MQQGECAKYPGHHPKARADRCRLLNTGRYTTARQGWRQVPVPGFAYGDCDVPYGGSQEFLMAFRFLN